MKPLSEITSCVIDAGTFIPLAEMMGRVCKRSCYYSPFEQEYLGIDRCSVGVGMPNFERLDEPLDPANIDEIDLWIFPDIGFTGWQKLLRDRLGKLVWGAMGATDLELYRTRFLKVTKEAGLAVVHSRTCRGLTELAAYLKETEDKWVKVNRYRENMETWHHYNWKNSQRELERLAMVFGPMKERIVFVVQDPINSEEGLPVLEVGYDGWSVDGENPEESYQGYEKKNTLYLGSKLRNEQLPAAVRHVNEAMAPVLREYRYRNFWATEIRIKGEEFHFIDPTARMAGQTMEHLLDTCTNLGEVIYRGAQGELIKPEFRSTFAAEATLHYTGSQEGWKTLEVPEDIAHSVKLYRCCFEDGAYQFPPHKSNELGVITGEGETIEECIANLKENFEALKEQPVSIDTLEFADLISQIQDAQDEGVKFTNQPVPEPAAVLTES